MNSIRSHVRTPKPQPGRRPYHKILLFLLISFLCGLEISHSQAPSEPKNLIVNGGFEKVVKFENLYDGIDANNTLKVPYGGSNTYREGLIPFSPSPCFTDVNGDKLPDLVVASPLGFLYWYPNTGKPGQPVFTNAHLIQTYLGTAARIHVADWNGDGKPDIIFGNIQGQIYLLLNHGSVNSPAWITAMGKPRWFPPPPGLPPQSGFEVPSIRCGKDPIDIGNYSAPVFADWNKDGLPDLIVGEGSYSANSIRIWLNSGSLSNPSFKPESKFYLAFGEGKEQLTPFVYDWNGDGIMDLLVGDRAGRISLFLGAPQSIQNPRKIELIEFAKFIKIGGQERIGSLVSFCVCDYNEDGIPDLIYGTSSGSLMLALGAGKRDDPELTKAVPLKGTDTAKDFKQPSGWTNFILIGAAEGSPYTGTAPLPAVLSKEEVPTLETKESSRLFHLSWFEKFYGWFPMETSLFGTYDIGSLHSGRSPPYVEGFYIMSTSISSFTLGKTYELNFWKKGDMSITYRIAYAEIIPKDKGPPKGVLHEFTDVVAPTANWTQYRKTYRFEGTKEKDIDTTGKVFEGASLILKFIGTGDAWIDKIQLIEVTK